jgi:hypothetical protein
MGLLFFHSGMEIGKNSFVAWMRVCDTTTTSVTMNIPSLDGFCWVNVLSPMFRIIRIVCKNSWGTISNSNNNTICYISSRLVCNNSFIPISTIYLVSLLYYPPNPLSLGSGFFFGPLNAGNSIIPLRGGVLGCGIFCCCNSILNF